MKQKLFAFWRYEHGSLGTTFRGGEIKEFTENGRVKVKGFDGFVFFPDVVVPLEKGVFLMEKVAEMEGETLRQLDFLKNDLHKRLAKLLLTK